jgi:hypothetical protein
MSGNGMACSSLRTLLEAFLGRNKMTAAAPLVRKVEAISRAAGFMDVAMRFGRSVPVVGSNHLQSFDAIGT